MKQPLILTSFFLILISCTPAGPLSDATESEIQMAEMMGITVEELRNQTPEEHMHMMARLRSPQVMQMQHGDHMMDHDAPDFLPGIGIDVDSLPEVEPTETIEVLDGDVIELNPTLVKKTINGKVLAMYGYNKQIPGPIIKAKQGTSITVNVQNNIDMNTTVHWHGLRHDNKDDGVPDVTQPAIEPGGSYTYTVRFPDEGVYWYHPHVREDIQQDMGLYGNLLVEPLEEDAYAPVNSEEVVVLDDLLFDAQDALVPYAANGNFQLMGRFGNVMLVNGEPVEKTIVVPKNSVVRYYMTNVSNTRTFNLDFGRAKVKLIGSDLGRYEKEQELQGTLIIAPAERYIVDVLYWEDESRIAHYDLSAPASEEFGVGGGVIPLLWIETKGTLEDTRIPDNFSTLHTHPDVIADIDTFRSSFDKEADKTLRLSIETTMMHGMNHGMMQGSGTEDGIEWSDSMPMMNEMSNQSNTQWKLIDEDTGKINMDIHWQFTVGDVAKVRIINDAESDHPMQHPMHFHGQRFLVLDVNGVRQKNLVWKDTVLVPTGSTVDLLFDMSNPGEWMFHCHIAEHLTNGMMGMMTVLPKESVSIYDSSRITKKPFGVHISPESSPVQPEKFTGFHTGTDFEVLEGETTVDILSVCAGKVEKKEWVQGYGGLVIQLCTFEEELATVLYGHVNLASVPYTVGDIVPADEFIGTTGVAYSEETDGERAHLHLGIHKGNEIDLRGYVQTEDALDGWHDSSLKLEE